MKKRLSIVAIILTIIMLLGVFAGCSGSNNEPDTDTSGSTESSTSGTTPGETEEGSGDATDESNNESETGSDNGDAENPGDTVNPVTLSKLEDAFPEVSEYETVVSRENFKPATDEKFDAKIEAENYDSTTISNIKLINNSQPSGGALMQILTGSTPEQGWDYVYSVSYVVNIPRKGYYQLMALTSDLDQDFTSNYSVELDGRTLVVAASSAKVHEDIDFTFNKDLTDLMFLFDLGIIALEPGEHTFTFKIDNEDSQKGATPRISFFMDYFTLTETTGNVDIEPGMTVGVEDISRLKDSDVIAGASKVSVYDQRLPLKLTFAYYFTENGDAKYTINDYYGKAVFEGTISGIEHDVVLIERLIKNHPTGYFTFNCGRQSFSYVVTPSYATRVLADSPFGMDLAAYYHLKTLDDSYNVTAAARLAGVTWVRDRARWDKYEATPGVYDFSSTQKLFETIDSTGMNLLVNFCGAPKWATESLGYNGTWTVAGFRDTQIEFYKLCKEMAAHYEGIVDAWELWNESDHRSAYETAEHFTAWYKAGALGILDAIPDTRVMFGGFCIPDSELDYDHLTFLNDILDYSNTYNYHAHIVQPKEYTYKPFSEIFMADEIHASLSLYNTETCRPAWITEAGMRIDNMVQDSYDRQANYIVTSTVESLSIGTEKHFWFVLAPYMEGGGDFGTFSPDLDPYPALAAESTLTRVLGKGEYVGMPAGLTKTACGYTFYTGERYASVIWSEREGDKYVIETDYPVLVTDMMGNETLLEPSSGKVTVRFGLHPVFVTYSEKPEILAQELPKDEMTDLTFTGGERVILSPEFENYDINDISIRKEGHLISDGLKINVRVTNLNDFEVKGTVSATLVGFEILDSEEITLAPYSEGFVTLTLKKTGDEAVNSYISFVGTFNGEETSRAAAHVRTNGALDEGEIYFNDLEEGQAMSLEKDLNNVTATLTGAEGTPLVMINDKVFENYTFENGVFTLKLYGMENGRYTLIVAAETDGGDYIFENIFFVVEDGKYTFTHIPVRADKPDTPVEPDPEPDPEPDTEVKDIFELVDFTVSVPQGREPVILQITDTQIIDSTGMGKWDFWAADKMGVECFDYITEIVNATNPDLILLTGDMIYGQYDPNGSSFLALIELMESFDVPWAPIFGNHEAESAKGIDWQCAQLEAAENCLFMQRELTGNGNYTVGIEQGGKITRVFVMLDSNGCNAPSAESQKNTHLKNNSGFGTDQINWYTKLVKEIKKSSPDTKLSFVFHIPLQAMIDSFAPYASTNADSTETAFIDRLANKNNAGDFGYIGDERKSVFDKDHSIWKGIKALGVDSIFVGHMHTHSASIVYEGVRLQFGMKSSTYDKINYINSDGTIESGYHLGGKTPWVGGSVMKLNENGTIGNAYVYYCEKAGGNIDWDSFDDCNHSENTEAWVVDTTNPQYEKSTCSACGKTVSRLLSKTQEGLLYFNHQFIKDKTTNENAFAEIKTDGEMSYVRFNPVDATSNKKIDLYVNKATPLTNLGGYLAILYRTSVEQDIFIALDSNNNYVSGGIQKINTTKTDDQWQVAVLEIKTNDFYDGEKLSTIALYPFTVERELTAYTDIAYVGFFSSEEEAREIFSLYEEAYELNCNPDTDKVEYYFNVNGNTNIDGNKLNAINLYGTNAPVSFDCTGKTLTTATSLHFGGWFATPGGISEYGFYVVDGSAKSEYTYLFTGANLGESFLPNVNVNGREWDVNSLKGANVAPEDKEAGIKGAAIDLAAYAGKTVNVVVVAKTNNGTEIELVYFNNVTVPTV